jgi:transcription initiation factor TFIIF subunit alpha
MSASPAQAPTGPKSTNSNNGGAPPAMRRPKPAVSIFNTGRKKPVKKAPAPAQKPVSNGAASQSTPAQVNGASKSSNAPGDNTDENGSYDEYPITIQRSSLDKGIRYHALKLHSRTDASGKAFEVNPYDESQFVRPLRLHRRYARDKMEVADMSDAASGVDDKERELMTARRAERQAEREENQKLIAPTGGESSKPVKKKAQKKVEEGRDNTDPARMKRQQLRYEEARPWHLEDFEGKNIWVGSYEQALSEHSIMLVLGEGGFQMVPIEKWYKFIQTNKVNAMDSEEVEKHMAKKFNMPRWALGTQLANEVARKELHRAQVQAHRARPREDDDDVPKREADDGEFQADRDMLDLDVQDEFQDDDEGMLFQGDEGEDGDDIAKRIYLEMRDAGLGGTGVKNEDVDPEEEERRRQVAEREEKKKSKRLRKQLRKKEHQIQYDSDSDADPYASSSESMDSDEEAEKAEEDRKKEEEAKKAAALLNSDKSGASSRGTNTPSGRSEKRDVPRLSSKRPGSPDASDLSGNESSRKRAKGINGHAVSKLAAGAGRSLSRKLTKLLSIICFFMLTLPLPADAAKHRLARSGNASGSDTDTSRTARPKLKLHNSPPGSPSSARGTPSGSRAVSPTRSSDAKKEGFPTLEDVRAAIPVEGIEIKKLVSLFKARLGKRGAEFITLVKAAGTQDKASGKIMRKGG